MLKLLLSLIAGLTLAIPALANAAELPIGTWLPDQGDKLIIDVVGNEGYLIHPSGDFMSFKVVSGQKRVVNYIGRVYYAATPQKKWKILSKDIKGDHITFGPSGRFLRLYQGFDERTAYGIHGHASSEVMLGEEYRYRSMGCIIVSEEILDLIEATFEKNGGIIDVETTPAMVRPLPQIASQGSWIGR